MSAASDVGEAGDGSMTAMSDPAAEPEAVAFPEPPPTTGVPLVDAAVARLGGLSSLPLTEQVDRLAQAHLDLTEALSPQPSPEPEARGGSGDPTRP